MHSKAIRNEVLHDRWTKREVSYGLLLFICISCQSVFAIQSDIFGPSFKILRLDAVATLIYHKLD